MTRGFAADKELLALLVLCAVQEKKGRITSGKVSKLKRLSLAKGRSVK